MSVQENQQNKTQAIFSTYLAEGLSFTLAAYQSFLSYADIYQPGLEFNRGIPEVGVGLGLLILAIVFHQTRSYLRSVS